MSMDSNGKIIMARHNEVSQANANKVDDTVKDGEPMALAVKELGSCEIYPQALRHSPNGRYEHGGAVVVPLCAASPLQNDTPPSPFFSSSFVVVCGDGEYIIHTALSFRNKSYGTALEFVWAADSNEYAVRESTTKVRLFKNFKEKSLLKMDQSAEGIYGGALLGVRGAGTLTFYNWETQELIRRIDIDCRVRGDG